MTTPRHQCTVTTTTCHQCTVTTTTCHQRTLTITTCHQYAGPQHHRKSASLREFAYSCPQTVLWFISMVSLADIVQSRSLRFVELVLSQAAHSEKFKMNLNYFDYKEIKRNCTLTA
ncbi:hypothetical protein CEXT_19591 [Caerostris extrusa]|uniref:Uncharacterized protein n=1 Tax=Caerostris extrusa TaxID=172846 RepID=A0AAV4MN22_CAEEX|nr:hypothetical protein CEXT_19591 [Caerostris extrusa]